MKVTIHEPTEIGAVYDFTGPAELRDFLRLLTSPQGYANSMPTVSMSADAAYMLAALAVRGEALPRTSAETAGNKAARPARA